MGTERGIEGDVARFLESADKVTRFENGLWHCGGGDRIGAEIAVAQIGSGEECCPARQIENDIADRACIIALWPERQYAARGRRSLREIVDCDLERAEMAFGVSDFSPRYRKLGYSRRYDRGGRFNQNGDVEMILEQVCGLGRPLLAAENQNDACAFELDERYSRYRFRRRREQCGHFRACSVGFTGPPGRLPNIGKLDRSFTTTFCRNVGKQTSFLRAGDREWCILRCNCAKAIELGAA